MRKIILVTLGAIILSGCADPSAKEKLNNMDIDVKTIQYDPFTWCGLLNKQYTYKTRFTGKNKITNKYVSGTLCSTFLNVFPKDKIINQGQ